MLNIWKFPGKTLVWSTYRKTKEAENWWQKRIGAEGTTHLKRGSKCYFLCHQTSSYIHIGRCWLWEWSSPCQLILWETSLHASPEVCLLGDIPVELQVKTSVILERLNAVTHFLVVVSQKQCRSDTESVISLLTFIFPWQCQLHIGNCSLSLLTKQ